MHQTLPFVTEQMHQVLSVSQKYIPFQKNLIIGSATLIMQLLQLRKGHKKQVEIILITLREPYLQALTKLVDEYLKS